MGKLLKVYDEIFKKGVTDEDNLMLVQRLIGNVSHKPTEEESELVNGDVGAFSYSCILEKKIRIVLYIED